MGLLYRRICEGVRDPLEANVVYLADGDDEAVLASLDLSSYLPGDVPALVEERTGVPASNVVLSCTHTHTGPVTKHGRRGMPVNQDYLSHLKSSIVDAAEEAVANARPVRFGWGLGKAHIGYNRRICWADGTHTMYGAGSRQDFAGLEGPEDPSHLALAFIDEEDQYVAIVHNNSCHATCMEMKVHVSADYPGEARRLVRGALGDGLPVLYLQGAAGDLSPHNMLSGKPRVKAERRLKEIGALAAGETLRLLHHLTVDENPALRHACEGLTVGVRLPTGEQVAQAKKIKEKGKENVKSMDWELQVGGVLGLYEKYKDDPKETLPLHVLRLGDVALATNPCEYYCQFGLDVTRRSPAAATGVVELTDGSVGYCPTIPGLLGGGYSAKATWGSKLEPYAGYKIVEKTAAMLHDMWRS